MIKTIYLPISQVISILLNFSVQLILASFYSKEDTGTYFSVISLMNILSVLGLFGINQYYIFFKSKYGHININITSNLIKVYVLMNVVSTFIFIIISCFKFKHHLLFIISSILLMIITNGIALISSKVQVKNKILTVSFLQLILPFFKSFGLIIGAFLLNYFLRGYSITIIILSILCFTIVFIKYFKRVSKYFFFKSTGLFSTLKQLFPYAILSITFLLYTQGNTFYTGIWLDSKSVAYFGLAYLFLNTVFIFPSAIYQKILVHKLLFLMYNSKDKFQIVFKSLQDLLIILSSFLIFFLYILADFIISVFFGNTYLKSAQILQILSFIIPFRLMTISVGTILANDDYVKKRIKIEILVTILNAILNFSLIHTIGIWGAIISVIVTEFLISSSYLKVAKDDFNIKLEIKYYIPILIVLATFLLRLPIIIDMIIIVVIFILLIKPFINKLQTINKLFSQLDKE